ncbi:MAG: quinone oxidoreductase [Acidimicrobiia bacterium]
MHAIQIASTGGPEVLDFVDIPAPEVFPGHLLVEVEAAGLNYIDTYHRRGLYPVELPLVPGMEGAGTVTAVGPGAEGISVGDRVAWTDVLGSYAEIVSVPADRAVQVPDDIDSSTAAAVMLQGITAHYLARSTYSLAAGERCLIHAGAGGVGRLLIQMAKSLGAVVFTTVGSPEKVEVASSAGADYVIDYRHSSFDDQIREIAGERPFDVVYDGVGAATFAQGLELLRPRGMMVTFGNASGPVEPVAPLELTRQGSLYLTRPTLGHYIADHAELVRRANDLFEWIGAGRLEVLVGATYPLADAARAHRALEGRATIGKTLLVP